MSDIEKIKQRVSVSEIVKEKVKLQRQGSNHIGRCPFHNEKTPSFTVNDNKQFYHCFGCGAHGDIFEFVMKFEGITFMQALSNLAEKVGIKVEAVQKSRCYQYEILELAVKWFREQLSASPSALQYIANRSITKKCAELFCIGYAPVGGVKKYLSHKGYSLTQMAEVGLISKNHRECFSNRIILPIRDSNGRVIAFGGRTLNNSNPKYLNSPECSVFKKSEILYGLNLARQETTDSVIIVEGYFDVIALHEVGIRNVVAPLGTAISIIQLKQLCQLYKEIIICFDGDNAGKNAILKTIKLSLSITDIHKIKFILLPNDKDPYDIVIHDAGQSFRLLLRSQYSISETLWHILSEGIELNNPEQKIRLKNELFESICLIQDKSVLKYYQSFFVKKLCGTHNKKSNSYKLLSSINVSAGEILIKVALSYPELLNNAVAEEQFATFKMETIVLQNIQDFIISLINLNTIDQISNPVAQGGLNAVIDKISNNQYEIQNKAQASIIWGRLVILEEIKHLELEYRDEMTKAFESNRSDGRARDILTHLLELKSLLHDSLE